MMGWREQTGGEAAAGKAVHVALGKDLRKGKVILQWVLKNLRSKEVVIVHVHQPPKLIPMKMGGKFPIHMATQEEVESYIAAKRAKMKAILHSYMHLCASAKISAKNLVIESEDVYDGIVYLVGQHQINCLVMGLRSIKGQAVLDEGLLSCNIWEALMQKIGIKFTGDENQSDSISSHNVKENSESYQGNAALGTSESWLMKPAEESVDCCSKVEEIDARSSKEDIEAEDIKDLLMKLAEAVHVVYQQRLELARQMFELKQEFIEFSLPEIEEATNQFIEKNKNSGRGGIGGPSEGTRSRATNNS